MFNHNINKFIKIEIINILSQNKLDRKKWKKSPNSWQSSNTPLNKSWLKEEITKEIREYNENTIYQNFWDEAVVGTRGKYIALNIFVRRQI